MTRPFSIAFKQKMVERLTRTHTAGRTENIKAATESLAGAENDCARARNGARARCLPITISLHDLWRNQRAVGIFRNQMVGSHDVVRCVRPACDAVLQVRTHEHIVAACIPRVASDSHFLRS